MFVWILLIDIKKIYRFLWHTILTKYNGFSTQFQVKNEIYYPNRSLIGWFIRKLIIHAILSKKTISKWIHLIEFMQIHCKDDTHNVQESIWINEYGTENGNDIFSNDVSATPCNMLRLCFSLLMGWVLVFSVVSILNLNISNSSLIWNQINNY